VEIHHWPTQRRRARRRKRSSEPPDAEAAADVGRDHAQRLVEIERAPLARSEQRLGGPQRQLTGGVVHVASTPRGSIGTPAGVLLRHLHHPAAPAGGIGSPARQPGQRAAGAASNSVGARPEGFSGVAASQGA
jgi:hypothetical protein